MYISEDKVSKLLKISAMQLRFILESYNDYKYYILDNTYYLSGNSITKLQKDIKQSQEEFEKRLEDDNNYFS